MCVCGWLHLDRVPQIGERLDDPFNGCRSVECVRHADGKVDKVEQVHTCDENCPLGWEYEPSPLFPQQCCGDCLQVSAGGAVLLRLFQRKICCF